jgi:hypothetical protein
MPKQKLSARAAKAAVAGRERSGACENERVIEDEAFDFDRLGEMTRGPQHDGYTGAFAGLGHGVQP